ncbi:MAG: 4Fe-4S binding protein, partial [Proteobacteria bacterium]|nr:4Fe-4S binding protein [Pseudomonadota bacterium]
MNTIKTLEYKPELYKNYLIKTNRTFTRLRKYAWLYLIVVPLGAWWYPVLGLSLIPLMLGLTVLAFFNGKYWCGNICPHGSLFDHLIMPLSRNKGIPRVLKNRWFITAVFTWFMVMLALRINSALAAWGETSFAAKLGFVFVMNYTIVTVVGLTLALFISPRSWCSFCPMGTMEKLSYKLGKLLRLNRSTDRKISMAHEDMCHKCGKCARVCPAQLTPYAQFDEKGQFSSENCIRCETCVKNCPAQILSVKNVEKVDVDRAAVSLEGYDKKLRTEAEITGIRDLTDDTR